MRKNSLPLCIGQKQIWFILRMLTHESNVHFNRVDRPEFDHWRWVDYWEPLKSVVYFKQKVYRKALLELGAMLVPDSVPICAKGYLAQEARLPRPKKKLSNQKSQAPAH
jgi:putative (di)nucleoside polyphosphate hydrolase